MTPPAPLAALREEWERLWTQPRIDELASPSSSSYDLGAIQEVGERLFARAEALEREIKEHAEWAREYGQTPDGEAWLAEKRKINTLQARVAALEAGLRAALAALEGER